MLSNLLTRTVTIIRRESSGNADELGDDIDDQTPVVTVGELQQRQRTEPAGQPALSDTTWLLVLPAGTAIDASDTVEVDGLYYEVIGEPWHARHPRTGIEHHIEATVQRVAGAENAS